MLGNAHCVCGMCRCRMEIFLEDKIGVEIIESFFVG